MLKKLVFFTLILIFVIQAAQAVPLMSSPIPQNDSYIYGRDTDIFSINISEGSLDTSRVRLHARVEDPTSIWTNVTMNCFLISSPNWLCNVTIPGLSSLVHDGNWLLYYFDGYDTGGGYGNMSNSTDPMRIRVDRSPPNVNFTEPKNESFSSGSLTISIEASDTYSKVNASTVGYSFDNSTWLTMKTDDNKIFTSLGKWNTTTYENNMTVNLYAKASDVLGNSIYIKSQTVIDNEMPRLVIVKPYPEQVLNGSFTFEIQAEDTYSGLDISAANYFIGGTSGTLLCSGNIHSTSCTATFSTKVTSDGKYQLLFKVSDMAKNERTSSISVIVDNLPPKISILSPKAASTVSGNVNVSASVRDDGVGVSDVSFRIESGGSGGNWEKMNCINYFCSALWNSSKVVDGTYVIRVYSQDKLGRETSLTVQISVVNTGKTPIGGTTTTTATTQTGTDISNFFDKIMKNLILILGLLSPLVIIPLFIYLSRREKPSSKVSTTKGGGTPEEYVANVNNIQSIIYDSISTRDINTLKDKVRLIIVYLRGLEKDFMKTAMEEASNRIEEKTKEEVKRVHEAKVEYLDEISRLLNDILTVDDINLAYKHLENVRILMGKFRNLVDREIVILNESLNK